MSGSSCHHLVARLQAGVGHVILERAGLISSVAIFVHRYLIANKKPHRPPEGTWMKRFFCLDSCLPEHSGARQARRAP